MRQLPILFGAVVFAIAVSFSWWLHSATTSSPLRSTTSETQREAARAPRLNYRFDVTGEGRLVGLVNQDPFSWNDVHVEIGAGLESFQCPMSPTIEGGHTLHLNGALCHSAGGAVPSRICVVRVNAREGQIVSAFEPCSLVQ